MNEIIPGIYRLEIPIPNNPLGHTNTYLLRGTNGYLLIDAGWDSIAALSAMKDQLSELELTLDDIKQILITHSHGDHYGLVRLIRQQTEAEIAMHRLEGDMLTERSTGRRETMHHVEEVFVRNGAPSDEMPMFHNPGGNRDSQEQEIRPDTLLEGGEVISTGEFNLTVYWTPGHSPGHVCLYEPEHKILFGGDHVLPVITPNISLLPHMGENPLGDFMQSLKVLAKLDVDIVLPAHEGIYYDLPKRIAEITLHHRQRNLEILETIKTGPKTAYQVSSGITWMPEEGGVRFKDLPRMHQRMALLETLAHLKAMLIDEELASYEENGTIFYRAA